MFKINFVLWSTEKEKYTMYLSTQKIDPHLWYDNVAKEAALFYISLFDRSKLLNEKVIENTPSSPNNFARNVKKLTHFSLP